MFTNNTFLATAQYISSTSTDGCTGGDILFSQGCNTSSDSGTGKGTSQASLFAEAHLTASSLLSSLCLA
jgi:hypothetical protein